MVVSSSVRPSIADCDSRRVALCRPRVSSLFSTAVDCSYSRCIKNGSKNVTSVVDADADTDAVEMGCASSTGRHRHDDGPAPETPPSSPAGKGRRRSLDTVWHDALDTFRDSFHGVKPRTRSHRHWECARDTVGAWLRVRGPTYLTDGGVKVVSERALCECKHVDFFDFSGADDALERRLDVARRRGESWMTREREKLAAMGQSMPWTFVFHFVNPDGASIVCYFQPNDDEDDGDYNEEEASASSSTAEELCHRRHNPATLRKFLLDGDDTYRSARIKFAVKLFKGPVVLRRVLPSRPVLVGQRATTRFYRGEGGPLENKYLEVDLICASNATAKYLYSAFSAYSARSEQELAFWIEGTSESELPERLLGAVRLRRVSKEILTKLPP